MRTEAEIFAELEKLCATPGYAHVIAYFSWRENFIRYEEEVDADCLSKAETDERLLRVEISTLIGLLAKSEICTTLPEPSTFQKLIDDTQSLLRELHHTLLPRLSPTEIDPRKLLDKPEFFREAIFYASESAYNFQYQALAPIKYANDNDWIIRKKGFSIEDTAQIARYLAEQVAARFSIMEFDPNHPELWTVLPVFTFTAGDIS